MSEMDWRAFKEIYEAWRKLKLMPQVSVKWFASGENEETHVLATHATGFTYLMLSPIIQVT
jgi:hypothetical protein